MAGVDEIVVPDEHAGAVMSAAARTRGVTSIVDGLLNGDEGNSLQRTPIPPEWAGREVGWAHQALKQEHGAVLLALERSYQGRRSVRINPPVADKLQKGDILVLVAASLPWALEARRQKVVSPISASIGPSSQA
jgi:hypothetical protein